MFYGQSDDLLHQISSNEKNNNYRMLMYIDPLQVYLVNDFLVKNQKKKKIIVVGSFFLS